MHQVVSFASRCPRCERERVIKTHTRGELLRSLELGLHIEARCAECDLQWPIGPEERVRVARVVAATFRRRASSRVART